MSPHYLVVAKATGNTTSPRACRSPAALWLAKAGGPTPIKHEMLWAQAFLVKEAGRQMKLAFFANQKARADLQLGNSSWDFFLHSADSKGCQGAGGGCLASVAGGRGVLQDKQGWLLPTVLSGDSEHEWTKHGLPSLGALGR